MSRDILQIANVLERIKLAYNLKNNTVLADFLGVNTSTISTWKSRNSMDYYHVFAKCKNINMNWLLFGEGEMFSGTESGAGQGKTEGIEEYREFYEAILALPAAKRQTAMQMVINMLKLIK